MFQVFVSKAQEDRPILDIFAQEGLVDISNLDLEFFTPLNAPAIHKMGSIENTVAGILNNFDNSFYEHISQGSFSQSATANLDSIIALLKTADIASVNKFSDSLYLDSLETMKVFMEIGKRIEGNLQAYERVSQELIRIKSSRRCYMIITFKAEFKKAAGVLTLYFRLSNSKVFGLAKMVFLPYDNQQSDFLTSLAQNDLEFLRTKDFKSIEAKFTTAFAEKIGKGKEKLEKKLLKYDVNENLLTYRYFIQRGKVYVVPVFHTSNKTKDISIRYVMEDKKFLIDGISIMDQYDNGKWKVNKTW
ncbi:MAG: hypothetical protein JWO06_2977 [Bacteroidota bacterium]|nr:hypothetical protein [Bacteroidota bacterium]